MDLGRSTYTEQMKEWEKERRKIISQEDHLWQQKILDIGFSDLADHNCFKGDRVYYKNFNTSYVGSFKGWEITIEECKHCGFKYMRSFMDSEIDGRSHSGRWVMGRIPQETEIKDIDIDYVRLLLANYDRVFYGGSYWKHAGKWTQTKEEYGTKTFKKYCV